MQLKYISGLRPITITGILLANCTHVFSYSDIDTFSNVRAVISNNSTANYMKEVDSDSYSYLIDRIKFDNFYKQWKDQTLFLSSIQKIVQNENFQYIVSMGEKAVPFILIEINSKPSLLVWALNFIYNKKITENPNATIEDACKLWTKALNR